MIFDRFFKSKRTPISNPIALMMSDDKSEIKVGGYIPLSRCPEVQMAINYISELVSSMTIYVLQNTKDGDERVKDNFAKKIDVAPNRYMTRKAFIYCIVKQMLLTGNCIVYPKYRDMLLDDLILLPGAVINNTLYTYTVSNDGNTYSPDEILNFVCNPNINNIGVGDGYKVSLQDVVKSLAQADKTKKTFMSRKYQPSLIVRVDGNTAELADEEGRKKLLDKYIYNNNSDLPWVIPADLFDVKEIKPLSLNDLAIIDGITLDKKSIARILGVPNYVTGADKFNKDEYRNFIDTKIKPIAESLAQEMTNKLIISPDRYIKFSAKSLYNYNLTELGNLGMNLYVRGLMLGNEVRDMLDGLGLSPLPGLNERVILENYIPAAMIGQQKKLNQTGDEKDE